MYNTHSTLSAGKQIRLKTVADVTNGLQGRSAFVLSTAETYDAKVCSEVQEIGRELKKGNETEKKKTRNRKLFVDGILYKEKASLGLTRESRAP